MERPNNRSTRFVGLGILAAFAALSPLPPPTPDVKERKMKASKSLRRSWTDAVYRGPAPKNRVARRAKLREEQIEVGMLRGQSRKQAKRALFELHHKNRQPLFVPAYAGQRP